MLTISRDENGTVHLAGIFDGSQSDEARRYFDGVLTSCDVDFTGLKYISSAGLGVLMATQKRLAPQGAKLRLVNMSPQIRKIFDMVMFGVMFEIK